MPKMISHFDGCLSIQFLSGAVVLTNIIQPNNVCKYIEQILMFMRNIHCITMDVDNRVVLNDVNIEVNKKVLGRFNEYDWI